MVKNKVNLEQKNKSDARFDYENLDPQTLNTLDTDSINLSNMSFEESVKLAESISEWMQAGCLTVDAFQKAYKLGNNALGQARRILNNLTLTMEVVGDRDTALHSFMAERAQSLFTELLNCVKHRDVGAIKVCLQKFSDEIVRRCEEEIKI